MGDEKYRTFVFSPGSEIAVEISHHIHGAPGNLKTILSTRRGVCGVRTPFRTITRPVIFHFLLIESRPLPHVGFSQARIKMDGNIAQVADSLCGVYCSLRVRTDNGKRIFTGQDGGNTISLRTPALRESHIKMALHAASPVEFCFSVPQQNKVTKGHYPAVILRPVGTPYCLR